MPEREDLTSFEGLLAEALVSGDLEGLHARLTDLPEELRAAARCIDRDGFAIASMLTAKLRFERLMNASAPAGEWFERDAEDFTAAFKRYHREVPLRPADPWAEAEAFAKWMA